MPIHKETLEARRKNYLDKRLSYFSISYDNKNERYVLIDDLIFETIYIRIVGNKFVACDGGSLNTKHRNFITEFLKREKILPE